MKYLSIVIPSYNSEAYLASCLDSLNIGLDNDIEVIVVNDGSKDNTSRIAHEYSDKYPFIKVIDKENGGHGSAFNVTIDVVNGLYYKVLDSDDHLDKDGLLTLIEHIKKQEKENNLPDIYLSDFKSVSLTSNASKVTSLRKTFKKLNEVITAKDIKRFPPTKYLMLHMMYIKTSLLKESHIRLLEHTFYEDNELVFKALYHASTYCYLDTCIYLYSIGRIDQSISIDNMAKNYLHQARVSEACIIYMGDEAYKALDKYRRRVMLHEIYVIAYLTYTYCYLRTSKEKKKKYKELNARFKANSPYLYKKIRYRTLFIIACLVIPFLRGLVTLSVYNIFSLKTGWRFKDEKKTPRST